MADNKIVPGTRPANTYTTKEAGYTNTIKGQNTNKNNPAKVQRITDAKGNTTGYLLRDKKGNVLERQDAQGKVIKDDYNKVSGITGMETDKAASKTQDVVDTAGNKKGKLRLTSDNTVYKAEDAAGDTIKSNYSTMNAITGMPDEENAPVNYLDANKPAPAGASGSAGGVGTAGGSSSTGTEEAMPAGISTDEPTEDLSTPEADWKSTDEIYESMKDDINNKAAATPEMKSIWSAWKNGDIDKATRNYFIADALAKFAGDMGNISHAQHANNMWANIESGNQINPMENVKGENQWQDYLKTDWKEAQKLKNEARSKQQLGNIDNNLEIAKKAGLDNYAMNVRPGLMKDSNMAKLSKENPDLAASVLQLCAISDGKTPYNGDDLVNLTRTKEAIDQALKMGDETVKQMGTTTEILGLQKKMTEAQAEYAKALEEAKVNATKAGASATWASAGLINAQTRLQNVANEVAEKSKNSEIMGKQMAPYLNAANTALNAVNTLKPY